MKEGTKTLKFHMQNPRRFPGFAVVVVIFLTKFSTISVFSECVFVPRKINIPIWWTSFFRGKVAIPIRRETNHTFSPTEIYENNFAKVSFSVNYFSLRIIDHLTTIATNDKRQTTGVGLKQCCLPMCSLRLNLTGGRRCDGCS